MFLEADVIDRVETYVRHPVFDGSDEVIMDVLRDLESKLSSRQISPETFHKLRDLIHRSTHVHDRRRAPATI